MQEHGSIMRYQSSSKRFGSRFPWSRMGVLQFFLILLLLVLLGRLYQLQILHYQQYSSYAKQRMEDKIITASRGRILLKDGDQTYFELANNVSLQLLYADPSLIALHVKEKEKLMMENPERAKKLIAPGPEEIAKQLTPILFGMIKERSAYCGQNALCMSQVLDDAFFEEKRYREKTDPTFQILPAGIKTEAELSAEYISDLTQKLSQTIHNQVTLKIMLGPDTIQKIGDLKLPGIKTTKTTVVAMPKLIENTEMTAMALEPLLKISLEDLKALFTEKPNHYLKIKNRIDFQTAEKIKALKINGLGFSDEHWRNYSEQERHPFASQTLGFLDHGSQPIYGIEKSMQDLLAGRTGHIRGEVDLRGRMLTARGNSIEIAVNGTDVVLTLDHVIQKKVEELLEQQVKESQAAGGEVLIQDPFTGHILAMAISPGFDPNNPGSAYEKEPISLRPEEIASLQETTENGEKRYFLPFNPGYKIEVFKQADGSVLRYRNKEGIRVYRNSTVSDIYEPGSVLKTIVMAAAIDSKEVRPNDIFHDTGPLQVDCHSVKGTDKDTCDYTIKNATNQYFGAVTITQILEKSLNTGMAHISKKLGPALLYDYLKNFGFGEKTFIELPDEQSGKLPHYRNWVSESDMITKAFGQGIAVTPIQLINALSTVVNGGLLMQPTIIAGTLDESGHFSPHEPNIIRRVIREMSSGVMKAILVSSVERGYAQRGKVDGYKVGGKTGTSQIATKGQYEKGEGSTIASFAGFAPYDRPRFVILVKINRPRTSIWGESNAGPLFKNITEFLLNYLQVPPENEEKVSSSQDSALPLSVHEFIPD